MHILHVRLPLLVEDGLAVVARHAVFAAGDGERFAEVEDPEAFAGGGGRPGVFGGYVVFAKGAEGVWWRVGVGVVGGVGVGMGYGVWEGGGG